MGVGVGVGVWVGAGGRVRGRLSLSRRLRGRLRGRLRVRVWDHVHSRVRVRVRVRVRGSMGDHVHTLVGEAYAHRQREARPRRSPLLGHPSARLAADVQRDLHLHVAQGDAARLLVLLDDARLVEQDVQCSG